MPFPWAAQVQRVSRQWPGLVLLSAAQQGFVAAAAVAAAVAAPKQLTRRQEQQIKETLFESSLAYSYVAGTFSF